jgi:hypothetical protein
MPSASSMPTCPLLEYSQESPKETVNAVGDVLSFPFVDLPLAASNVAVSVFLKVTLIQTRIGII